MLCQQYLLRSVKKLYMDQIIAFWQARTRAGVMLHSTA